MNMLQIKSVFNTFVYAACLGVLFTSSCKKETFFTYEVDDVRVAKERGEKGTPKSTVEFISIAYTDILGTTITQSQLSQLSLIYLAFGDKRLLEDLLIRNMINSTQAQIPSDEQMRADIPTFVKETYLRIYNREPDELELFELDKRIETNPSLSAKGVFFALMTSDEYRYY
jgi:hypothetical protein